jgi:hypothetical protein
LCHPLSDAPDSTIYLEAAHTVGRCLPGQPYSYAFYFNPGQAERRHLFKKGPQYKLPVLEIGLATVYVSVVSEFLFPLLSTRFTYDTLDFIFFFLGAVLFYGVEKRSAISETT